MTKRQSLPPTVLFRTTLTRTITLDMYKLLILLGSNHLLNHLLLQMESLDNFQVRRFLVEIPFSSSDKCSAGSLGLELHCCIKIKYVFYKCTYCLAFSHSPRIVRQRRPSILSLDCCIGGIIRAFARFCCLRYFSSSSLHKRSSPASTFIHKWLFLNQPMMLAPLNKSTIRLSSPTLSIKSSITIIKIALVDIKIRIVFQVRRSTLDKFDLRCCRQQLDGSSLPFE